MSPLESVGNDEWMILARQRADSVTLLHAWVWKLPDLHMRRTAGNVRIDCDKAENLDQAYGALHTSEHAMMIIWKKSECVGSCGSGGACVFTEFGGLTETGGCVARGTSVRTPGCWECVDLCVAEHSELARSRSGECGEA